MLNCLQVSQVRNFSLKLNREPVSTAYHYKGSVTKTAAKVGFQNRKC